MKINDTANIEDLDFPIQTLESSVSKELHTFGEKLQIFSKEVDDSVDAEVDENTAAVTSVKEQHV